MESAEVPLVGDNVPAEAVEAALSFVYGCISNGYEEDFFVLDSELISIVNIGGDDDGGNILVDLEYAYFSVRVDDLKAHVFNKYNFEAERIRFVRSELIEEGGYYHPNPAASGLVPVEFGSPGQKCLINNYKMTVDQSVFEGSVFEMITEGVESLDEQVFNFEDLYDELEYGDFEFEDIRAFHSAASTTLSSIADGSFDFNATEEWWSSTYRIDADNLSMFGRILAWRLGKLEEMINSAKNESDLELSNMTNA